MSKCIKEMANTFKSFDVMYNDLIKYGMENPIPSNGIRMDVRILH